MATGQVNGKPNRVLVVDDEVDLAEVIAEEIASAGFSVAIANDGHEALKLIEAGGIAFVLSDIKMPRGNGIELLEQVRKLGADAPVMVMMTGYAALSESSLKAMGARKLLQKPPRMDQLLQLISSVLSPDASTGRAAR